ncbi:DUF6906 family protein [Paenibacillus pinihumi]|uniref:DUF6906 family protein n=1 Tax=Paenibacillus pinihumi TaxID=669462 RepID=UPI0003F9393B|nr:hypothetical protein [Paenibacillus pinihumi]
MKNGKRPTRRQKQLIKAAGWNPDNWFVVKHLPREMHLTHRYTGTAKVIPL